MKILIVDDSRAMQTIVRRGIEQLGYDQLELKKADNGKEALDIIRVWEPDLVISDWHMPEMTGLDLLLALKREMLGINIGLVTTESSEKKLQQAIDAGAQFVVQKPFDSKTLHEAVLPIIQGSLEGEAALIEQEDEHQTEHITIPSINQLNERLNCLFSTPMSIQKTEPIVLQQKGFPYLLGLYSDSTKKSVHAIAIADIHAACVLGAMRGGISEEAVHIALAERALPKDIMDNCQFILNDLATLLYNKAQEQHLTLRSANVMRKPNPNVEKLLKQNTSNRLDITISVQHYGCGKLTFIVA